MAVDVLDNSIVPPDDRRAVEEAVTAPVGEQPGAWKVWLSQTMDKSGFSIRIDGPNGAELAYRFLKPYERSPEFVRATIRAGLRRLNSGSGSGPHV